MKYIRITSKNKGWKQTFVWDDNAPVRSASVVPSVDYAANINALFKQLNGDGYLRSKSNQVWATRGKGFDYLVAAGFSNLFIFDMYNLGDTDTWLFDDGYEFNIKCDEGSGGAIILYDIENNKRIATIFSCADFSFYGRADVSIIYYPVEDNPSVTRHSNMIIAQTTIYNVASWQTAELEIGEPTSQIWIEYRRAFLKNSNSGEPSTDPYDPAGVDDGNPQGGDGDFDDTSDPIPYPDIYPDFSLSRGFMRIWQPTSEQLSQVASWLWTSDFVEVVKKMFGNPMESIFSVHALPTPNVPFVANGFKLGNVDAGFSVNQATQGYTTIDCGSIDLKHFWGSALDYLPYTKLALYLPYVGIVQLNTDECMQKTIQVRYKIDLATGTFLVLVTMNGDVYYHYNGSCKYEFPVSGSSYSQIISNALGSIATAAGALASAAASGGMTAPIAVGAVGQIAANTLNSKPTVQRSGSLSDRTGWFDVQKPYLIVERPIQSLPAYNNTFEGYPANANVKLGDMKGFTQVRLIHLENIPATDTELAEIERLLKEGILI